MKRKLTLKLLTLSTSKAVYTLNKLSMEILGPSYPCFTWQCSWQIFARRYRKNSQRKSWRSIFFSRIEAAQICRWRIIWITINLHRDNMTWSKWFFYRMSTTSKTKLPTWRTLTWRFWFPWIGTKKWFPGETPGLSRNLSCCSEELLIPLSDLSKDL